MECNKDVETLSIHQENLHLEEGLQLQVENDDEKKKNNNVVVLQTPLKKYNDVLSAPPNAPQKQREHAIRKGANIRSLNLQ